VSHDDTTAELSEALLDDLSRITDQSARAQFLAQQRLRSPLVVEQLNEAARKQLRVDPRQSLSLADAAIDIASFLGSEELLGPSLRAKANALYVIGDNPSALEFHGRALAIFRKQGNHQEEARTLNASIQPYILLGNYDRALEAAQAARDIFKRLGDGRRLAHVEINVGNLYHRQERFEEGLACYERAYEMFLPFADSEGLGIALYNMSVCLISLNDFPRALASYERARGMFVSRGMTLLVGQADYNIAYLYYLRGEYSRAITMLRAAREQSEINGDAHILALCYLDLSDIYLELNLSSQACEAAQEGVQRFERLGMGYEQAKCLANEAIAWSQQGKPRRALDSFAEARAVFVREGNQVWPWLIDLYSALAFFDEGRFFEAQKSCKRALGFFETSSSPGKAVLCDLLLSRIQLQNRDSAGAVKHCGDALARARLAKLEMPILEYQAHYFMGQAHSEAGNQQAAYSSYQRARAGLETLRSKLRKEELKIAFVKDKAEVYERLIDICLNQNHDSSLAEAFQYIELTKYRSLADLILNEMHEAPKGHIGNSEMVRRIRDLREELNWYYHRIELVQLSADHSDPARVAQLQAEADAREMALVDVLENLPASAPEAQLFRPAEVLPPATIQASLPAGASLIEYFAIGDRLFAALLTHDRLEIYPVTLLSRVAALVTRLRAQLSSLRPQAEGSRGVEAVQLRATQNHLQNLYGELLEPLIGHLPEEHLVVVPHGILHAIPFHALFDGKRYVIDRFTLSYAPSGSIYARCQSRVAETADSSLVLGLGGEQTTAIKEQLSAIASAMNSTQIFLGAAATAETLRELGPHSRWIHIANQPSDGRHDTLFPGMKFGGLSLGLPDFYQLQLRPELISLTGFAPGLEWGFVAGDLVRSLLESGTKSLLSTLWDAPGPSSTEFLRSFYAHCTRQGAGASKAKIYQIALGETRALYPHPFHWAPFCLAGAVLPE
jgi:tetratricopeptide (TPR) repeat protein